MPAMDTSQKLLITSAVIVLVVGVLWVSSLFSSSFPRPVPPERSNQTLANAVDAVAKESTPASREPASSSDSRQNDSLFQAQALIGLDDGGKILAGNDDIRVLRAKFLLEYLNERTSAGVFKLAMLADRTSIDVRSRYGVEMSRLEVLESARKIDMEFNKADSATDPAFLFASVVAAAAVK